MCQHSFSSARRSRYEVLSCQPHWHLIVSDGVFCPDGDFYPWKNWAGRCSRFIATSSNFAISSAGLSWTELALHSNAPRLR